MTDRNHDPDFLIAKLKMLGHRVACSCCDWTGVVTQMRNQLDYACPQCGAGWNTFITITSLLVRKDNGTG